jgi:hypothetical protein
VADTLQHETAAILTVEVAPGRRKAWFTSTVCSTGVGDPEPIYRRAKSICPFSSFALFNPAMGVTSVIPDMNPSHPAKDSGQLVQAIHTTG